MATMMQPPFFDMASQSGGPPGFKSGSTSGIQVPPLFNPSMPPPSFNSASNAGALPPRLAEPASSSAATSQTPFQTAGSTATSSVGFQQRQYRFKPTATVNLAEAEGYGRRLRRNMAQVRRHIDAIASVLHHIEDRVWQTGLPSDQRFTQPHALYSMESTPPNCALDIPVDCVTTKFVRSAMNKVKCPIYDICWTPEGRRLVTGASSGEFTLWNGTAFNFETILQAHDTAVRAVKWSHNDLWMISADHDGFIKYWQANMNNVTMFQAHKEAVRSVSFCPSDVKFATASDDGTVRVWDFIRCHEEKILRGHGSDVRCVDWHPRKALLASGSRDNQQPVKLWDPRTGQCLATLHDHKNAVMSTLWNENGNWLITGSRDHLIKLYDIRMMKEMMTFRGHKKEVTSLAWHPVHEGLLVSGGADGALMFWLVTNDKEIGIIENAHEQAIWTLKWHPLGHILASGSNDNNTKFWTRNKAGDTLEDFYFVTANAYDHPVQQRVQSLVPVPAASQPPNAVTEKLPWEMAALPAVVSSPSSAASCAAPARSAVDPRRPPVFTIPGMGLEGEMFEKLREQQFAAANLPQSQGSPLTPDAGGIPGLGGIVDASDASAAGGRKTLLKQPPPKKAQRQFERVWNVNSRLQGSMFGPEDEGGPPLASDIPDYRKPKPSLLGAPPPSVEAGPAQGPPVGQMPPLLGPPPQQQLTNWSEHGGDNWRPQGGDGKFVGVEQTQQQPFPQRHRGLGEHGPVGFLLPTPTDNLDTGRGGQWFFGGGGRDEREHHGDVDLRQLAGGGNWGPPASTPFDDVDYRDRGDPGPSVHGRGTIRDPRMQPRALQQPSQEQQSDYRFQNWIDPGSSHQQQQSVLDRRGQQAPVQQSLVDPRRQTHQHPQALLSLSMTVPPNGAGFGGQLGVARSRSEDQESDQEYYGSLGDGGAMVPGMGRNAGAPTNPKRKWKQEYEAEEKQGSNKRWALSTDSDSPPSGFQPSAGDKDDRHLWGRPGPNHRR